MKLLLLAACLVLAGCPSAKTEDYSGWAYSIRRSPACSPNGLDVQAQAIWCEGVCRPLMGCDYPNCVIACHESSEYAAKDCGSGEWGFYFWSNRCPNHLDAPKIPCDALQCK